MKVQIATRVSIAAQPSKVYEYLCNLKYHYLWNPHIHTIKPLMRLKLGSVYESTSFLLGIEVSGSNEVSKLVKDQEIELRNTAGTVQYRANYRLEPAGRKTLVICTTTVATENKAFAFARPVLKMLARHELQSDLQALKIAAEQGLK